MSERQSKAILLDASGKHARKPATKRTPYPKGSKIQNLTGPQKVFAAALIAGKNQTEAYLEAYPSAREWARKTVTEKACTLAKHPQITSMVADAQAQVIAAAQDEYKYGLREAIDEIDKAIQFAIDKENPSAVMKGVELKTRLHGLHVEDRQNLRRPYGDLSEEALLAQIAAKTKALGL